MCLERYRHIHKYDISSSIVTVSKKYIETVYKYAFNLMHFMMQSKNIWNYATNRTEDTHLSNLQKHLYTLC